MVWLLAVFLEGLLVVLLDIADRQCDVALAVLSVSFPRHGPRGRTGVEPEVVSDDILLVVAGGGEDAVQVLADQVLVPLLGGELLPELAQRRLAGRPFPVLRAVHLGQAK